MEKGNSLKELKEKLYSGYFVGLIFLIGAILRNYVPWSWLRILFIFGLITILFELIPLQYKYFKIKKMRLNTTK